MNYTELKDNEVYYCECFDNSYIFRKDGINSYKIKEHVQFKRNPIFLLRGSFDASIKNIRVATPEQEHWLKVCFREQRYVSIEEALKTYTGIPKHYFELVESSVTEKDLIEEAKRRYPIGTEVTLLGCYDGRTKTQIIEKHHFDGYKSYRNYNNAISSVGLQGYLYDGKGTWAEIGVQKKAMFKKDDYIVCLKLKNFTGTTTAENYVTKQKVDCDFLRVYSDIIGTTNGYYGLKYDKSSHLADWRYATAQEIAKYEELGRAYNILTLLKETELKMFKKDDYIVTLTLTDGVKDYNCAKPNYCFKQRADGIEIKPCVDMSGSTSNGHSIMTFDKKRTLSDWRYATSEEITEYERIGKPYDVTTLKNKTSEVPIKWKVKITTDNLAYINKARELYGKYKNPISDDDYDYILNDSDIKLQGGGNDSKYTEILFIDFQKIYPVDMETSVKKEISTSNYIKGKWYKLTTGLWTISDNWYIKFKEINEAGTVMSSEYIHNAFVVKEGNFGKLGEYTLIEISLEDIQTYLPDGHVDKFPSNFVIGKWSAYGRYYIKPTKITKGRIDGESINRETYKTNDYWSNSDFLRDAKLLTNLSEIQIFLPDGHIDKIKKEEMTFEEIKKNVGKYVSFYWGSNFIDEALIHKEKEGTYYFLNNVKQGLDGHSDKSIYKYGYYLGDNGVFLSSLSNIKFIDPPTKQFIKGKWYQKLGTSMDYYAKYDRSYSYSSGIWVSEYIYSGKYTKSSGSISYKVVELADMEVVSKYLPDGHPDKVSPSTAIPISNLKPGDWVVVLPQDPHYFNCEQNKAQLVVDVRTDWVTLKFKNGSTNSYKIVRKAYFNELSPESVSQSFGVAAKVIKRKQPPQEAPIYEVKKVKVIKRTED